MEDIIPETSTDWLCDIMKGLAFFLCAISLSIIGGVWANAILGTFGFYGT